MDHNHRFNRDEISRILKRAAELEHAEHVDDDSEGLTVSELEQVSKDVGIHPQYIQKAVHELQKPAQSVSSNLFGGPFSYYFSDSTKGTFTDEEWEEMVSEIRRIHGGIGKTGKLGNTFEWEQRKQEVGYIQIALSPKKNHTKISITASYTTYATVIYTLVGAMGFALLTTLSSILFKKAGLPLIPVVIISSLSMLGLLAGSRFYLSHWMKNKRKTYSKLFERFQNMLSQNDKKNLEPSIEITEPSEEDNIPSGRKRTR